MYESDPLHVRQLPTFWGVYLGQVDAYARSFLSARLLRADRCLQSNAVPCFPSSGRSASTCHGSSPRWSWRAYAGFDAALAHSLPKLLASAWILDWASACTERRVGSSPGIVHCSQGSAWLFMLIGVAIPGITFFRRLPTWSRRNWSTCTSATTPSRTRTSPCWQSTHCKRAAATTIPWCAAWRYGACAHSGSRTS